MNFRDAVAYQWGSGRGSGGVCFGGMNSKSSLKARERMKGAYAMEQWRKGK